MGMSWAEHSVEIEAPIEVCFDAIVDYESFPELAERHRLRRGDRPPRRRTRARREAVRRRQGAQDRLRAALRLRAPDPDRVGLRRGQRDARHGRRLHLRAPRGGPDARHLQARRRPRDPGSGRGRPARSQAAGQALGRGPEAGGGAARGRGRRPRRRPRRARRSRTRRRRPRTPPSRPPRGAGVATEPRPTPAPGCPRPSASGSPRAGARSGREAGTQGWPRSRGSRPTQPTRRPPPPARP